MKNIDEFGQLISKSLRDQALERCVDIIERKAKSQECIEIHDSLSSLTDEQISVVKRLVTSCVDTGIHDFLYTLGEKQDELSVSINGKNIVKESDGLNGELFSDDGWFAKYSKYGESGI
ncbi:DUF6547 family protein [Vibrio sp. TRT 21S02]|uniref:DUF6547 family protein n=1 Tax=Vibrio sp. TRT 21S02 TaxID=3418507 RepID=UPI003CFA40B2|nr:hypothetical protein [Vibrio parahaemolyticus]